MKKIIFGIFAHPDDEAFGPCGTFLKEISLGNEVHIITLTAGEAGQNPDEFEDLGQVRLEEWRKAGELMGAQSLTNLGYRDGHLTNTSMIEIAEKIETLVRNTIENRQPDSYEFLAFDFNGISGHIDHIVASRAVALVFYRLKQSDHPATRLRLFCLPESMAPRVNTQWLFMEAGRAPDEIDEVVDARAHADTIRSVIRAHHSQREDAETHLARHDDELCVDHYRTLR